MAYKTLEDLRLYRCYSEQKYRCTIPTHNNYADYGGRGIQFKFNSFIEWKTCLGPKPSESHSVDRIDNNGHYEPGNIHWATRQQQSINKRNYKSNTLGIKGVSYHSTNKCFIAQQNQVLLYRGSDFFEACCARKSSELKYI